MHQNLYAPVWWDQPPVHAGILHTGAVLFGSGVHSFRLVAGFLCAASLWALAACASAGRRRGAGTQAPLTRHSGTLALDLVGPTCGRPRPTIQIYEDAHSASLPAVRRARTHFCRNRQVIPRARMTFLVPRKPIPARRTPFSDAAEPIATRPTPLREPKNPIATPRTPSPAPAKPISRRGTPLGTSPKPISPRGTPF